ncbi:MAG: hypothetical protein PQJ61_13240 [Spirochaetales bacterium]|uniref:Uncharacterized protein n=1 Tax=Candidatus Thalassospirochaeta sargassi TaxID=3119039 RepID=A0AAJ1IEB5_9SPIO|nr:hypothetical protein [Spirochaetales bacterium]
MHISDENTSVYDSVAATLEERAAAPGFNIEDIRSELDALYRYSGLGWAGRGMIKEQEINSSIMAYEVFLVRYREKADNKV